MQRLHAAVTLAWLLLASTTAFDHHQQLLTNVIDSIEAGLTFMAKEHTRLNLDAVIGTRFVEGIYCRLLMFHLFGIIDMCC